MPKKVTPRWGEPGINNVKVPTFTLSDDQFAKLCTHLDLSASDIPPQLKPKLEFIGTRYRLWIQQDEKGPSQAERNAALKKLLASRQDVKLLLAQLDSTTQGELLDLLWSHPGIKSRSSLPLLDQIAREVPELVIDCARWLLAEGNNRRGPASRKTLPIIIGWLALIYEETTELNFTHTPYEKTRYRGTPQSRAGQFVTEFLKMVDPKLRETAIATEIARFVGREGSERGSPVSVQTI
jgi:hypothetical protein